MDFRRIMTTRDTYRAPKTVPPAQTVSTGSTLVNLALTGHKNGGFPMGKYLYLVGDSSSGKTWSACTCFAEAAANPVFAKHRLILDDVEGGAMMDYRHYFGDKMADRLETRSSEKIEDFYDAMAVAIAAARAPGGRPFIYVLDSMDSLDSKYAADKDEVARRARATRSTKKVAGDYGDGKAKTNSRHIRRLMAGLRDTNSILIIISQTRDNVDAGMFESKKTRSGGKALRFYAAAEIWTSPGTAITREVNGKKRQIGINATFKVCKNRLTGKDWSVSVPIYWSYGIDDLGGCVDFLVDEKHWKRSDAGTIDATDDFEGLSGKREALVAAIIADGLEEGLRDLVAEVFTEIVRKCTLPRPKRYE